jgi:hypothetical protein
VLHTWVVSRRRFPWLSGFSALLVLLASLVAAEIRPQAADPLAWRSNANARADLEVVTSADRSDSRVVRSLASRSRLSGAGPAATHLTFTVFLFTLPVVPPLPGPQIGRAQGRARMLLAPASFRPGASSARGPPRRAFA